MLLMLVALFVAAPARATDSKDKYTYVMVHGATAGGWEWKRTGKFLTDDGHTVHRATLTGLGERMHVLPPVLSGGEKQRAAIARALIEQPEILLADEPTGNVDPPLARRLLRLFIELNRLGTAVLIATHDLGLMDQVEARRMVLAGGRLDIHD